MGPFIGIIVYCAIAYYVVPRAYEIETAKGPEADLKRLEVRVRTSGRAAPRCTC